MNSRLQHVVEIINLLTHSFVHCLSVAVTNSNGSAAVDRVLITWSPESCQSAGVWTDAVLNLSMSSLARVYTFR